jgi:hypothetical protein
MQNNGDSKENSTNRVLENNDNLFDKGTMTVKNIDGINFLNPNLSKDIFNVGRTNTNIVLSVTFASEALNLLNFKQQEIEKIEKIENVDDHR